MHLANHKLHLQIILIDSTVHPEWFPKEMVKCSILDQRFVKVWTLCDKNDIGI